MTEASDTLRNRRVVVLTSGLRSGYNDLWDAVEREVGALAVVGARPSPRYSGADNSPGRTPLRSFDLGRGLIWEHLVGFRRFVRRFRADLVHVNRELWAVASQEILSCGAAVVVHGAENLWHHGGRVEQTVRDRLIARAVRRIDGYGSWNHAGAEHVSMLREQWGLPPIPILVLPAVIPPAEYHTATWRPVNDGVTLRVLLVGRATQEKGFQDVIEVAARLPAVRITLCGAGEMLDELIDRAHARGVALDALGFVSPGRVAAEMARAHVLVQPSLTTDEWAEQFGRSVAEAMTLGLPSVVSDSGELPFVVGHDRRAIFGEGDVDDLHRCLQSLTDAAARKALSEYQQSLASAWRADRAGAELTALWSRVLA